VAEGERPSGLGILIAAYGEATEVMQSHKTFQPLEKSIRATAL